ncbi:MAG: hypothetical protein HKN20_14930, partial [Gemmatimonadetes bacterium]|nr:hypothetical protein [Gemmatimonadota bacterium]
SDETPDREAWGDTLEAHEYDWILHDKNGGKWFINGESEICNQGRINLTNLDAARAYAKYIAKATVHEYPDLIEGIRLDEVAETIHWWHSVPQRWDPGVDSIDSNRDGIGDSNEDLTLWWSAGVDTFLATLRAEFGPEYLIIVNGYLAPEHFQYVNGRWHEGHPHEHRRGYESGMTDPERGYLGGDTLYSDTPAHFSGLFCLNFTPSYDYDPDELSTKHVPFPHPGLPKYVKWTLASSLMSDGWHAMSGWGTSVDYKGDPKRMQYQTLWWFDVYDSVRAHIGTPTGDAVRETTYVGLDSWQRDFTGGRVRIFPFFEKGIYDFRPSVTAIDPAPSVRVGDPIQLSWDLSDPNSDDEPLDVDVYLSRDGGATYPELIGSFDEETSSFDWTATGSPGENCWFKVVATDTSDLVGEDVASAPFLLASAGLVGDGLAEVAPGFWIVNAEEVLCTLDAAVTLVDSVSSSWDEAWIVLPADAPYRNYYDTRQNGGMISESVALRGDTIVVSLATPVTSAAPVSFVFGASAPGEVSSDSLRFAFGVRSTLLPDSVHWVNEGNANGDAGDSNALRAWADYGPPVSITVAPGSATVATGVGVSFSAQGFDAVGNAVAVSPVWAIDDTIGTIDTSGFFSAVSPGTGYVIGSVGALLDSASVTVTPGAPHIVEIDVDSLFLAAGETYDLTAVVRDSLGNPLSYDPLWTIANDSLASVDSSGVVTAIHPGTTTVTATVNSVASDVFVSIVPGPIDNIALTPPSATIARGDTVRFSASPFDAYGHPLEDAIVWSATDSIGEVHDGLFLGTGKGAGSVTASSGGVSASSAVQVVLEFVAAFLTPATDSLSADSSVAFHLYGVTSDDDTLAFDANWSVVSGGGSIDAAGTYTPGPAGEVTIGAVSGAWSDSSTFTVTAGAAVALALDGPGSGSAGDTLVYTATVSDANGNPVSGGVSWPDAEGFANLGNGSYRAVTAGAHTITASYEALGDEADVTVTSGPLAALVISPDPVVLAVDSSVSFAVDLRDAFGNAVVATVTWTIPSSIGSLAPDRTFTASAPGSGTLVAHAGAFADSAHVTVSEPEPETGPRPTRVEISLNRDVLTPGDDSHEFEAELTALDSAGWPVETEQPESIFVDIREVGDHPAKGVVYWSAVHVVTLPATLSFDMSDLAGCGAVELAITTLSGLAAASDPLSYRTSNLDGDEDVGLGDIATLLALETDDDCRDLDGDGAADGEDVDLVLDLIESYAWEGETEPATEDDPFWVMTGDTSLACGSDSLAPTIELHPGATNSVYGVLVTTTNEGGAAKQSGLSDETVSRSVTDEDGSVHWIYVSDSDPLSLQDAGAILSLAACDLDRGAWEAGGSYVRFLGTDFVWSDPVEVSLKAEETNDDTDTTGGTDDVDTTGGTDDVDTTGGTDDVDTTGGTDDVDTTGGTDDIDTTANETTIVAYTMLPSQPNPFRGHTLVRYALPNRAEDIEIVIHDMSGREIRRFRGLPDWQGSHAVEWNGVDHTGRYAPSGVYFVTLQSTHGRKTSRITLVR